MARPKILENISTIQNSGFTNRAKQAGVTSYKELGNGRWFGELTDAPESGVFFYNVFKGDNDNYKYVEAMSWINDKIFISKCINGEWSAWEDRKSVLESKFNVLSDSTLKLNDNIMSDGTDWFTLGIGTWSVNLNLSTCTNTPESIGATNKGTLVVFKSFNKDSEWGGYTYIYTCSTGMYICNRYDKATNLAWQKVATTSKTEILFTPKPNITITQQKNVKINNILYVNTRVTKTDGTKFKPNIYQDILSLPQEVTATPLYLASGNNGVGFDTTGTCMATNNNIAITILAERDAIRISGVIIL